MCCVCVCDISACCCSGSATPPGTAKGRRAQPRLAPARERARQQHVRAGAAAQRHLPLRGTDRSIRARARSPTQAWHASNARASRPPPAPLAPRHAAKHALRRRPANAEPADLRCVNTATPFFPLSLSLFCCPPQGVLSADGRRTLSRLIFVLFTPCLAFDKMAPVLSASNLLRWLPLPANQVTRCGGRAWQADRIVTCRTAAAALRTASC